jgi:hypothetical protein
VHTGKRIKAAARVKAPVRVQAVAQKLFIVLRYDHTEKDYISGHSYAIWETKLAPNSKTLPHIEFPTLNNPSGVDPMSVFEAHFKEFFYTKDTNHPRQRIFGKNVQYTEKIKFSDGSKHGVLRSKHGVLRIGLHNIPDERLAQKMLASLGQRGKKVKWIPSEKVRSIFSPSIWQRWITGLKFSTQPESEHIWDILSSSPDYFPHDFWTKLIENKD